MERRAHHEPLRRGEDRGLRLGGWGSRGGRRPGGHHPRRVQGGHPATQGDGDPAYDDHRRQRESGALGGPGAGAGRVLRRGAPQGEGREGEGGPGQGFEGGHDRGRGERRAGPGPGRRGDRHGGRDRRGGGGRGHRSRPLQPIGRSGRRAALPRHLPEDGPESVVGRRLQHPCHSPGRRCPLLGGRRSWARGRRGPHVSQHGHRGGECPLLEAGGGEVGGRGGRAVTARAPSLARQKPDGTLHLLQNLARTPPT